MATGAVEFGVRPQTGSCGYVGGVPETGGGAGGAPTHGLWGCKRCSPPTHATGAPELSFSKAAAVPHSLGELKPKKHYFLYCIRLRAGFNTIIIIISDLHFE